MPMGASCLEIASELARECAGNCMELPEVASKWPRSLPEIAYTPFEIALSRLGLPQNLPELASKLLPIPLQVPRK